MKSESGDVTPHDTGIAGMMMFGILSSAVLLGALGLGASFWYRDWAYLKGFVMVWLLFIPMNIGAGVLMYVLQGIWRGVRRAI